MEKKMEVMVEEVIKMKDKLIAALIDLLKPRTIFAMMFYSTLCYLILRQFPVPDILNNIVSFLMGFYFGQKNKESGNDK